MPDSSNPLPKNVPVDAVPLSAVPAGVTLVKRSATGEVPVGVVRESVSSASHKPSTNGSIPAAKEPAQVPVAVPAAAPVVNGTAPTVNGTAIPAPATLDGTSTYPITSKPSDLESYDYVIKVEAAVDDKSKVLLPESEVKLRLLVKTLELNRFEVQVRPDSHVGYLLFSVKQEPAEFEVLLKRVRKVDALYGVNQLETHDTTKVTEEGTKIKEDSGLTSADRLRLVNLHLVAPTSERGAEITVGQGKWTFVKAIVPVSSYLVGKQGSKVFSETQLSFVSAAADKKETAFLLNNYGSKYTFYFKAINMYVVYLVVLAAVGIVCHQLFGRLSKVFTGLNLLLGLVFYLTWYASEKKHAVEWGTVNVSKVDVSRTDTKDPPYKVLFRKAAFAPIALSSSFNLVAGQFACFLLEIFLTEIYQGPGKSLLALVPTIIVCTLVPVFTAIYGAVVNAYLGFENNPTYATQSKSQLIKMFVYNFLASYVPLFITSFVYLPVGYKLNPYLTTIDSYADVLSNKSRLSRVFTEKVPLLTKGYSVNSLRLSTQYQYFILTNQIVGLITEYLLPPVLGFVATLPGIGKLLGGSPEVKAVSEKDAADEKELLADLRHKLALPAFDVDGEFRQLVLQFGFLIMFGPTWSIGPAISLVVELIQSRLDFLKLVKMVRPPVPDRAESSYPWPFFFKTLLLIGSFVSVCLTLMYNGGDLVSYSDRSTVKADWLAILPLSFVSAATVMTLVYVGEVVIDEYFNDPATEIDKRNKQLEKILRLNASEKAVAVNNVDSLIEQVTVLPSQVAKAAEQKPVKTKKQE